MELQLQREARPREAFAARYRSGRPPAEREAVARRAGDGEMTEIPHWCDPLVRTWPQNAEPEYLVVADGHWLAVDVSPGVLRTLTGGEFEPAASPAAPWRRPGCQGPVTPPGGYAVPWRQVRRDRGMRVCSSWT